MTLRLLSTITVPTAAEALLSGATAAQPPRPTKKTIIMAHPARIGPRKGTGMIAAFGCELDAPGSGPIGAGRAFCNLILPRTPLLSTASVMTCGRPAREPGGSAAPQRQPARRPAAARRRPRR